ncbi:hypothetical protein Pyn_36298 [Prunus yedoensis var. nudiflora]|uniref:Uncharacterized protein n=1 Tax=Prunus yedoensis var. nudiflora TaxID=2094558 RepID=A0A314UBG4_PRUYE|nr:hypothetical protein Pyn_36298 [Prunus yedoensis var. nudiflora]
MRDCGMEGYGRPQGPRKLLDNEDFGLATWEHQSPSPLLRVLQCGEPFFSINWEAFAQPKPTSLGCCKLLNNHENSSSFLFLAAASIPVAILVINLHLFAAANIPVAVNQHLLVAQALQQPLNHFPSSLWLLQAFPAAIQAILAIPAISQPSQPRFSFFLILF